MSALPGRRDVAPKLPRDDYEAFTTFLRRDTGIDLAQHRRRQMERRIRTFAGRRGITSLIEYAELLSEDEDERTALLDRLAPAGSQLFRSPEQWRRIAADIVPELVESGNGRIRAWSAGCARGADAFSLAATVFASAPGARLEVRASDVDRRVLGSERRGMFTAEDARTAPANVMERHFEPTHDGGWKAGTGLLSSVHFHHEDLLAIEPAPAGHDLVLCRNIVTSLTRNAREDVHVRIARSLREGGYVVVGSTERIDLPLADLGLEMAWPCAYRKVR